jgi:hypothetical protein
LVALPVIEMFVDIRREWDAALCFEGLAHHLRVALKVQNPDTFVENIANSAGEVGGGKVEDVSRACSFSWAYEGFVGRWPAGEVWAENKRFPVAAARSIPDQTHSTHTCFIDDEEISRLQEVFNLMKDEVGVRAGPRVDVQKPRGIARLKRCLRDAVIREDVIKRI